jgi:hypothetical protein
VHVLTCFIFPNAKLVGMSCEVARLIKLNLAGILLLVESDVSQCRKSGNLPVHESKFILKLPHRSREALRVNDNLGSPFMLSPPP